MKLKVLLILLMICLNNAICTVNYTDRRRKSLFVRSKKRSKMMKKSKAKANYDSTQILEQLNKMMLMSQVILDFYTEKDDKERLGLMEMQHSYARSEDMQPCSRGKLFLIMNRLFRFYNSINSLVQYNILEEALRKEVSQVSKKIESFLKKLKKKDGKNTFRKSHDYLQIYFSNSW